MISHRVFSSTVLVVVLLHAAAVCLTLPHKEEEKELFIGTDYYLASCGATCTPRGRQCSRGCSCVVFGNAQNGSCYKVNETDISDWDSLSELPNNLEDYTPRTPTNSGRE
uniref:Putative evasin n=1 Tax=Amblyomma americanum TaxID=6943 RepID=A0A0C9S3P7_AMBAM